MYRFLMVCLLILVPGLAQAQTYTWHLLNIGDPDGPGQRLNIRATSNGDHLLGNGRRVGWRIDPARLLRAIICPPNPAFPRNPAAFRLGPDIEGLNNALRVAGSDEALLSEGPRLVGVLAADDGTCEYVRVLGAAHTLMTAVADDDSSAGIYIDSESPGPGLSRFHGFERAPDGTILTLAGLCANEYLSPESRNPSGNMVGFAYCDITPTATAFVFKGWARIGGVYQEVTDPAGQTLWLTTITANNVGYGITAIAEHVVGGKGWKIDFNVSPPSIVPTPLPPPTHGGTVLACGPIAGNDLGWFVCTAFEMKPPPCEEPLERCSFADEYLAIPDTPPPVPPPAKKTKHPKKGGRHGWLHAHEAQSSVTNQAESLEDDDEE